MISVKQVLFAVVLVGCSSNPDDKECPLRPAFQLHLQTATGTALPADTVVRVKYGGGVEEYRLDEVIHSQENVFCQHRDQDGGPVEAGAQVGELSCVLWTQGAATITVEASGYPDLEKDLEAKGKNRCIETVDVTLTLDAGDGGI
jgi:hypothetical protein